MVSAWGDEGAVKMATDDPATMLTDTATRYVGAIGGDLVQIFLITSLFAALLSFHNVLTRYIFSLGQHPGTAGGCGRSHVRHASPYIASVVQTVSALVLVVACVVANLDPVTEVFTWFAGAASVGIVVLMTLTSAAVVVYFGRTRFDTRPWHTVIAPVPRLRRPGHPLGHDGGEPAASRRRVRHARRHHRRAVRRRLPRRGRAVAVLRPHAGLPRFRQSTRRSHDEHRHHRTIDTADQPRFRRNRSPAQPADCRRDPCRPADPRRQRSARRERSLRLRRARRAAQEDRPGVHAGRPDRPTGPGPAAGPCHRQRQRPGGVRHQRPHRSARRPSIGRPTATCRSSIRSSRTSSRSCWQCPEWLAAMAQARARAGQGTRSSVVGGRIRPRGRGGHAHRAGARVPPVRRRRPAVGTPDRRGRRLRRPHRAHAS